MKKIKFYYSDAVHVRMLPVITDAEGNVLYVTKGDCPAVKKIPRVTVAAILDTKTDIMTFGSAICAPADTFKKKIGREVATKRTTEFPEITVRLTKRNHIREVSKRYANQLIARHLNKYLHE